MRGIVLTSTMRRHQFLANTVAGRLEVAGVWQEEKAFEPEQSAGSAEAAAVIREHLAARDASEAQYFAGHDAVQAPVRRVFRGGCNAPDEIQAMRRLAPDVVLVFGTSLLKQPLIDAFAGRVVNVHLGLSPYYRGAGTNFWPLVNGEPEYCGATIHVLDIGVDSGPILAHVRPDVQSGDGPHDIGNRTIAAAAEALADVAAAYGHRSIRGVVRTEAGRVYRRADFSADAVRRLYANFAAGMIAEYLRERAARDGRLSLLPLPTREPQPINAPGPRT